MVVIWARFEDTVNVVVLYGWKSLLGRGYSLAGSHHGFNPAQIVHLPIHFTHGLVGSRMVYALSGGVRHQAFPLGMGSVLHEVELSWLDCRVDGVSLRVSMTSHLTECFMLMSAEEDIFITAEIASALLLIQLLRFHIVKIR